MDEIGHTNVGSPGGVIPFTLRDVSTMAATGQNAPHASEKPATNGAGEHHDPAQELVDSLQRYAQDVKGRFRTSQRQILELEEQHQNLERGINDRFDENEQRLQGQLVDHERRTDGRLGRTEADQARVAARLDALEKATAAARKSAGRAKMLAMILPFVFSATAAGIAIAVLWPAAWP